MRLPFRSQFLCVVCVLWSCAGSSHLACGLQLKDSQSASENAAQPGDEPSQAVASPSPQGGDGLEIPGPLRSFLRMAGISQQVSPDDVMPTLARNLSLYGYRGTAQTEYLALLDRYVHQARELTTLAGADGVIRVASCNDASRLIPVLGYKFERVCKSGDASLITANPEAAFLTIDSGFPLATLERDLATGQPFNYPYASTRVSILFTEKEWAGVSEWKKKGGEGLLDELMHDQDMDRLYAALATCDEETRSALLRSPGLHRLVKVAAVFDLYGRQISIHSGTVQVPADAQKSWEELVGANPHSSGKFVLELLSKDNGWMVAYFDALSRLSQAQQAHFADLGRLKRLYAAYRSTATWSSAAHGVFPKNAELLVLLTSLKWDSDGNLEVPGGIGAWRQILSQKSRWVGFHDSEKLRRCCDRPEALLETLVAGSNVEVTSGPTQVFLMLAAINAGRPAQRSIADATEVLVAKRLAQFDRWFPIFAEFPTLDDSAIVKFVAAADKIDGISNPGLRANALGAFQAEVGLWQILARQGQIPEERLNVSWQDALEPYLGISSSVQLFQAARASLKSIVASASGNADPTQDQIVDTLAGPAQQSQEGQRVHQEIAAKIRSVLDDQRLASLDSLFGLFDGLTEMAHGKEVGNSILPFAESLREFEMPRPIFSGSERSSWAPVVYSSRHAELQVRTDLAKLIRSSASPAQLEAARGSLTPFLRDTLVGLNYAYYEPPGAQVLHNNPLFVRSHDFSSISVQGLQYVWGDPQLIGVGATAGGGAYLLGSMADLPYALASMEAEFIAPKNVQALTWQEVVPGLLVSSIVPRWWNIGRNELHAAALYQRAGEEILKASASDQDLRGKVLHILSDRMGPDQLGQVAQALQNAEGAEALVARMLPADTFFLAEEMRRQYPGRAASVGPAERELEDLARSAGSETNPARLAADFGVPHPVMAKSETCTLFAMKPVPAFGGEASGLMAESWESNNLYWARLADEMGYSPQMLNLLIPALTRRMIVNIFGSNIDDWPALSRAMRETGIEFQQGKIFSNPANTVASE